MPSPSVQFAEREISWQNRRPLGMIAYQCEYSTDWQLVLAFVTLTILPAVVMFIVAQKYLVAGLTAGAVKG